MEDKYEVILYSNGCPRCMILEQKLAEKNVGFVKRTDIDEMISMGLKDVPWIKIDNKLMNFSDSLQWINNL